MTKQDSLMSCGSPRGSGSSSYAKVRKRKLSGRSRLLALVVAAMTLLETAMVAAQTPIAASLIEPMGSVTTLKYTDIDSRMCSADSGCEPDGELDRIFAVGTFDDGSGFLNIFVVRMYNAGQDDAQMLRKLRTTSTDLSLEPTIQVGSTAYQVVVVGATNIFYYSDRFDGLGFPRQGYFTKPISDADYYFSCFTRGDDFCYLSAIAYAPYILWVTMLDINGQNVDENFYQYQWDPSPTVCFSCCINGSDDDEKEIIVGGRGTANTGPGIYVWRKEGSDNTRERYEIDLDGAGCGYTNTDWYVGSVDQEDESSSYQFVMQSVANTQEVLLARYYEHYEESLVIYAYTTDSDIVMVKSQITERRADGSEPKEAAGHYYVQTATHQIILVVNTISYTDVQVNEYKMAFPDSPQSGVTVIGYAGLTRAGGGFLAGNYVQYSDSDGASTTTTQANAGFIHGVDGINSVHSYSGTTQTLDIAALSCNALNTQGNLNIGSGTYELNGGTFFSDTTWTSDATFGENSEFTFDRQQYSQCGSNTITFFGTASDLTYAINPVATTTSVWFPGFTTSLFASDCPITRTVEYYDQVTGVWEAVVAGTPAFVSNLYGTTFDIDISTSDSSFHGLNQAIRLTATDPESTTATASVSQTFIVSFTYNCFSDTMTLDSAANIGEVVYELSTPTMNVGESFTQLYTDCPKTVVLEYYDTTASQWVDYTAGSSVLSSVVQLTTSVAGFGDVAIIQTSDATFAPVSTFQMRTVYTSTESLDVENVLEELWTLKIQDSCDSLVLSKTSEIPDGTIRDGASPLTYSGYPAMSYTGNLCSLTATLYKYVDNGWVDSSSIGSPNSFTQSDDAVLNNNGAFSFATNDASALKPQTTEQYKITVEAANGKSSQAPLEWTFSVTTVYSCSLNTLTLTSGTADVAYEIIQGGGTSDFSVSTSDVVALNVAPSELSGACAVTLTTELLDEATATWNEVDPMALPDWIQSLDGNDLKIQTDDYATYASTTKYLRFKVLADDSTQAINYVYDSFSVVFTYQCINSKVVLDPIADLDVKMGSAPLIQISASATNVYQNCASTSAWEVFDEDSQAWVLAHTQSDWYVSSTLTATTKMLEIFSLSVIAAYQPEKTFLVRLTYVPTYSTLTDNVTEQTFSIRFYDPCYGNFLTSITSTPVDQTMIFNENAGTISSHTTTAEFSRSVTDADCTFTFDFQIRETSGADNAWYEYSSNTGSYAMIDSATQSQPSTSVERYVISYGSSTSMADITGYRPEATFEMKLTVQASSGVGNSMTQTWTLLVKDECAEHVLTSTKDTFTNFEFLMGQDSNVDRWLQLDTADCPVTYSLEYKLSGAGTYTAYNAATSPEVLGFADGNTVTYDADNTMSEYTSYAAGQDVYIKQTATSDLSVTGNSYSEEYIVTFRSVCTTNELTETNLVYSGAQVALDPTPTSLTIQTAPTGTLSAANCPLTYTLEVYENYVWTTITQAQVDSAAISYMTAATDIASGSAVLYQTQATFEANQPAPYDSYTKQFKWTVTDPLSLSATASISKTMTITFSHDCSGDYLTHDTDLTSQTVDIGASYTTSSFAFTQNSPGCDLSYLYEIYHDERQTWETYSAASHSNIVQSYNGATSAQIKATDQGQDQITYNMRFTVSSVGSTHASSTITDSWTITFRNQCRDQNSKTFVADASPVALAPKVIYKSFTGTINLTYDTWGSLVPSSGCTLTVQLRDVATDTLISSSQYSTSVSLGSTAGTILIDWTDDPYSGEVAIVSYLAVPGGETVWEYQYNVFINVIDLCAHDPYFPSSGAIADISYNLNDAASSYAFNAYYDYTLLMHYTAICGPMSYAIVDSSYNVVTNTNIAFVSGTSIRIEQKTDIALVTNADVLYYLRVQLDDYADVYTSAVHYEPFNLNIKSCIISSFNSNADAALTYNVYAETMIVDYVLFTENPLLSSLPMYSTQCGYAITYEAKWRTYYNTLIDLPYFITWSEADRTFTIYSTDENDLTTNYQTYTIELIGTVAESDQSPVISHTQTITLTVSNGCVDTDVVTTALTTIPATFTYYLGGETESPLFLEGVNAYSTYTWDASWTTSVYGCPFTYQVQIYDSGTGAYRDLDATEATYISLTNYDPWVNTAGTIYNSPNVQLVVYSDDVAMDQTSYTLNVSKVSTHSTVSSPNAAIPSVISWRHVCWDMTKTPAYPPPASTFVWLQENKILTTYTGAVSGWTNADLCGPYTYTITYNQACGGSNEPSIGTSYLAEAITVNTATNQINAYLDRATYRSSVDSGFDSVCFQMNLETTYGIYGSGSMTFNVQIIDPCSVQLWPSYDNSYTGWSVTGEISDWNTAKINVNGDATSFTFDYPQEYFINGGAILTWSDSYSLCGERIAYLISDGSDIISTQISYSTVPFATLVYDQAGTDGYADDTYTVQFKSTSENDYGLHTFVYNNNFAFNPMGTTGLELNVQIDPCLVTEYTPPSDLSVSYTIGDPRKTIEYIFAQYPCSYDATYSIYRTDTGDTSETLPSFVQFSTTTGVLTINSYDADDAGSYQISVNATLTNVELLANDDGLFSWDPRDPPTDWISNAGFFIDIELITTPDNSFITVLNTAPYFVPRPTGDLHMLIGSYFAHSFGQTWDLENDNVVVEVDLGAASPFARWEEETNSLIVSYGSTDVDSIRSSTIVMRLTDDNSNGSKSSTYQFNLILDEVLAEGQLPTESSHEGEIEIDGVYGTEEQLIQKIEEVEEKFEKRVYDLRNKTIEQIYANDLDKQSFDSVDIFEGTQFAKNNSTVLGEEEKEEPKETVLPVPRIESLSSDGILTIRFSKPIQVPERYQDIEESKVALRWLNVDGNVEPQEEKFLIGSGNTDFEIRPALDLQIVPSQDDLEPKDVDFDWEIVSFKENEVQMQLTFTNPEMLSTDPLNTDDMLITFWASDFFVSEDGYEIKQGQTLQVNIIRQIDKESGKTYEKYARIFGYVILGSCGLCLILALWTGADTVPIWAMYDTLLLISHLPLMNVNMPGATVVFLTTLSKVLSFEFVAMEGWMIGLLNKDAKNENLGVLFYQAGYESVFIIVNSSRTVLALLCLLLLGLIARHLDKNEECMRSRERKPNGRTHVRAWTWNDFVSNMVLRVIMCSYLTITVSVFINMKTASKEGTYQKCSLVVAYTFLAIMGSYLLLLLYIAYKESTKERVAPAPSAGYQTVFLGLKWNGRPNSVAYVIAFMARRIFFAIVSVVLQHYPMHQIFTVVMLSTGMVLILQKMKPYAMPHNQKLQVMNELMIFCSCITLLSFTPAFNIEPIYKERVGYFIPYFVFTTFGMNLLLQIHAIWWQVRFIMKRKENMIAAKDKAKLAAMTKKTPTKPQPQQNVIHMNQIPHSLGAAAAEALEKIDEADEEDGSSYLPRRHQRKRSRFAMNKGKIFPEPIATNIPNSSNDISMSSSKPELTINADVTADNILGEAENMVREITNKRLISSWADISGERSVDISQRSNMQDFSKRSNAMINGMSTDKSVNLTREDVEVLDHDIDLSVFDNDAPLPHRGYQTAASRETEENVDEHQQRMAGLFNIGVEDQGPPEQQIQEENVDGSYDPATFRRMPSPTNERNAPAASVSDYQRDRRITITELVDQDIERQLAQEVANQEGSRNESLVGGKSSSLVISSMSSADNVDYDAPTHTMSKQERRVQNQMYPRQPSEQEEEEKKNNHGESRPDSAVSYELL